MIKEARSAIMLFITIFFLQLLAFADKILISNNVKICVFFNILIFQYI
jgi:hypothetical protein